MTHTPRVLVLATLVALTACDAPDHDSPEASPRDKVLYTDAASLEALAQSDSVIQDAMADQLELDGERLLDMALEPDASPDLSLTAPPSPSLSSSCVGLNDFLDFCYDKTQSGVWVWVEVLGVESPKDYLGYNGACDSGGLDVGLASATYTYCYWRIPVQQVYIGAEACWLGDCEDVFYAKFFD